MDSGAPCGDPSVKSKSKHSCWSLKTDRSKREPLKFRPRSSFRSNSGLNCWSMRSMRSKDPTLFFNEETVEPHEESPTGPQTHLDLIFMDLEVEIQTFVKKQLKRFHRVLASDYPEECLENEEDDDQSSSEAVLKITLDFLRRRMKKERLAEHLYRKTTVAVCGNKLKRHLQHRFRSVFEGVAKAGNPTPLSQIFTELYMTEGGSSGVNQEHEVRHIETFSKKPASLQTTITCSEIFKSHPESGEPIRTVMTTGVAGIGKTVLTQKFSLDWAEGRANQDIQLLFPFTFRELNVLCGTRLSLVGLLHHFFSEVKGLCNFQHLQILFIFDGLDECRLSLDFIQTPSLTEPTECVSVEMLLVNLIRGNLLPSANIWITTRPAAANQIPAECVSMVTEVPGFADPQKEEYFKKRFSDEEQATIIISHIKASRSLYIMCYMPIFCWILATVLLHVIKTGATHKLPHTLTQMYIQFLVVQAKIKNLKFDDRSETDAPWTPETRKMVESLGKLAFEQLQKGRLIFYESDLTECGLDAAAAAVYSGVFTQVFREEPGLYQNKVYCFVHLTVQEFLAALHVHQTFFNSGVNLLSTQQTSANFESKAAFYRSAVDRALQSPNGHLDLFLRFLLGLSLPNNQDQLHGLLIATERRTNAIDETVEYLKERLNKGLSSERSMNLFHCLNELNDQSLVEVIQEYMKGGFLSVLSCPGHWSTVAFILLSSDSDLKEFDLRKYQASQRALLGMLPVIKASTKAILSSCHLSQSSFSPLASVISSSNLTHLDLSNNDLQDSGVELLCSGLKSIPCRLETLRLSGCLVSERGGASLASVLNSALTNLKELDLSYNHLGPSAELLTALRNDPHSPLDTLRLNPAGERWMIPGPRKYCCTVSLDPNTTHRRLLLSEDKQAVTHLEEDQRYPEHEDRFMDSPKVLSATGLKGRHYWEVQWEVERTERWEVYIGLSYRGIQRRGERENSSFGDNEQSWSLRISDGLYNAYHNDRIYFSSDEVGVSSDDVGLSSDKMAVFAGRVGVFLDSDAGSLSFYRVGPGGELSHLHMFTSSFTEPLFPAFGLLFPGSTVSLVKLDV